MSIQIRNATLLDINQIESIEACLEHRILSYNTLASTLEDKNYYYFVATNGNIVIGYLACELLVDHFDILSIAVLNDYRRQNVATLLLNKFYKICSDLNIHDIFLEVRETNLHAINFYEKQSFIKISKRKNYYKDTNEDAYVYNKMV